MLQAVDLAFGYGAAPVIQGVSLTVPDGSLVGVIGPNGSGKTTLLRLLSGTRRPSAGQVTLDGAVIGSIPRSEVARRIAVVPQETHLAFDYSVLEVVLMGRYAHLGAFAVEGPADFAIAREALQSTGAGGLEARMFSTLSGGEKQRVVIASALAQITAPRRSASRTAMLMLDEPTAALDLKHQLGLALLLQRLHRDLHLTILVSTHDLAFAASLCSTIVMLKAGTVAYEGPTDDALTPARIRELYEVDADVSRHAGTGRLVVVPVRPLDGGLPP